MFQSEKQVSACAHVSQTIAMSFNQNFKLRLPSAERSDKRVWTDARQSNASFANSTNSAIYTHIMHCMYPYLEIENGLGGAHVNGRMVYAGSLRPRDREASGCAHAVFGSLSLQAFPFPASPLHLTLS